MYDAITRHPRYNGLSGRIQGQPEARILEAIAETYYGLHVNRDQQAAGLLSILVEDKSTNCLMNAVKTRHVLEAYGVKSPRSIIISQDPTMCRRTIASFEQVYSDSTPHLVSWPTFTPRITAKEISDTGILSCIDYVDGADGLWDMERFIDLMMGEIPRMRDDENGYGPNGKGSIAHVDIWDEVEEAWGILREMLGDGKRTTN